MCNHEKLFRGTIISLLVVLVAFLAAFGKDSCNCTYSYKTMIPRSAMKIGCHPENEAKDEIGTEIVTCKDDNQVLDANSIGKDCLG